jgi:hypothetical protein
MCESSSEPARSRGAPIGERRRIWEIDARMHCSVLGTCLPLADLYRLARRARCRLDPAASAYEFHSWVVDFMASGNVLSKLVDKDLEKRHAMAVRKIRGAGTEAELEARWKAVSSQGQIAGAYWAAMSHPLCSEALQWQFFGEIHMLSHLVGASRRADLCRVDELEVACVALDGELAELKHDHRASLEACKRLEGELALERRELALSQARLLDAEDRIAMLESVTHASEREALVAELERKLGATRERAVSAESAVFELRGLLDELRTADARASEQLGELTAENEALELELARSVSAVLQARTPESDASLCGKRILCVGGRISLVQYYRVLVERRGGEFLHHDGGLEESLDGVTRALTTVDVVVCPVDCVSHAACLKVKRACKHLAKRFIPLRSSGLSSFARGIQSIAS